MTRRIKLAAAVLLIGVAVFAMLRYAAFQATADRRFKGDISRRVFDPSRDAADDLQTAEKQAQAQHKNILMDVGGNWCPSCLVLDHMLRSDNAIHDLMDRNYVLIHVNWSSDNHNEALLGRYPEAHGYPALYVLSPAGQLIHAENTADLEQRSGQNEGYSRAALETFLTSYAHS